MGDNLWAHLFPGGSIDGEDRRCVYRCLALHSGVAICMGTGSAHCEGQSRDERSQRYPRISVPNRSSADLRSSNLAHRNLRDLRLVPADRSSHLRESACGTNAGHPRTSPWSTRCYMGLVWQTAHERREAEFNLWNGQSSSGNVAQLQFRTLISQCLSIITVG
jgi:hypothetical protein